MMLLQEIYMNRCIELASNGLGGVSPNPLVGSVIVHEDSIIGEGYHRQYGDSHAEVNAIASVRDKSLLKYSTLYVNLEPCSHWGKTPPCADLIIENKIPRVIIGAGDPYPEVNGRGIKKLRDAGIEVINNVLEKECRELNRRFITYQLQQRPYIILKWAETSDGFIARADNSSRWISSIPSRLMVHNWRSQEDAIMVGTNTAVHDNPELSSRDMSSGRNPLRIALDRKGVIPESHHLMHGNIPTLIFTEANKEARDNLSFFSVDFGSPDFLNIILAYLFSLRIQSLIVEGGSRLLNSFITAGLWDEARIFKNNTLQFGKGISAPVIDGTAENMLPVDGDTLYTYRNRIP